MTADHDLSVVLGGTGGIGGALVRRLIADGRRVRVVSRSGALPPGVDASSRVEAVAADITDPEQVARATADAAIVHQAAQPDYTQWPMGFPVLIRAVLRGLARSSAKLVVADNLYMYGAVHGVPMTEDLPYAATDRKGRVRAAMARELLDSHASGQVRVAIGRAAPYYGPGGVATNYGPQIFYPALGGGPAQWIGPVDIPRTMGYLPDIARALIKLGDSDSADGRAWHLPHAGALTGAEFLTLVFAATRTLTAEDPRSAQGYAVDVADRSALPYIAQANPPIAGFLTEVEDIWPQFEEPYLVDFSQFEHAFGPFAVTPPAEAVTDTVSWFRMQSTPEGEGPANARD